MAGVDETPARATLESASEASGATLLTISGELDLASVPTVEVELDPIVRAAREGIVFDLSRVTFMDSSGIAMLLRAAGRVSSAVVRNPSSSAELVIRATGLGNVLPIES